MLIFQWEMLWKKLCQQCRQKYANSGAIEHYHYCTGSESHPSTFSPRGLIRTYPFCASTTVITKTTTTTNTNRTSIGTVNSFIQNEDFNLQVYFSTPSGRRLKLSQSRPNNTNWNQCAQCLIAIELAVCLPFSEFSWVRHRERPQSNVLKGADCSGCN